MRCPTVITSQNRAPFSGALFFSRSIGNFTETIPAKLGKTVQ